LWVRVPRLPLRDDGRPYVGPINTAVVGPIDTVPWSSGDDLRLTPG
jgi:hypothetical protein